MAGETYRYNVVIGIDVQTSGVDSGAGSIEAQMTRSERKVKEQVDKIQGHVDKLGPQFNKITDNLQKTTKGGMENVTKVAAEIEKASTKSTAKVIDNNTKIVQSTRKRVDSELTEEKRFYKELEKLGLQRVTGARNYLKGGASSSLNSAEATAGRAAAQARKAGAGGSKAAAAVTGAADVASDAAGLAEIGTAAAGATSRLGALAAAAGPVGIAILAIVAAAVIFVAIGIKLAQVIFGLAEAFAKYGAEVGKAMEATGLAANTVSGLMNEAERFGIDFGQVASVMSTFRKTLGEAAAGSEEARKSLKLLGLDSKTAGIDVDQSFRTALLAITKLPPGLEQAKALFAAFGSEGYKLLPFFKSFGGDIDKVIAKAEELGLVMSTKDVQASKELNKALSDIRATVRGLALTFGREFLPAVLKALEDFGAWLVTNRDEIKEWAVSSGSAVMDVIKAFSELVGFVRENRTELGLLLMLTGGASGTAIGMRIAGMDAPGAPKWKSSLPTMPNYDPSIQANNIVGAAGAITDPAVLEAQRAAIERKMAELVETNKREWAAVITSWENAGQDASKALDKAFTKLQDTMNAAGLGGDTAQFTIATNNLVLAHKARADGILNQLDYLEKEQIRRNKGTKDASTPTEEANILANQVRRRQDMVDKINSITKTATDFNIAEVRRRENRALQIVEEGMSRRQALEAADADLLLKKNQRAFDESKKSERDYQDFIRKTRSDALQNQITDIDRLVKEIDASAATIGDPDAAFADKRAGLLNRKSTLQRQRDSQAFDDEQKFTALEQRGYDLRNLITKQIEQNADATEVAQRRKNAAMTEELGLLEDIARLQDMWANLGVNAALEYQKTWTEAMYEVERAAIDADNSIIRSNVRLNDAKVFHSNQAKAQILEHLASQETETERVANAIIDIYDAATSAINKSFDKIGIGKIPGIGGFLKGQAASWLTGMTRGILDAIMPGAADNMERQSNPMLAEAKDHTKLLTQIATNTGGVPIGMAPSGMRFTNFFNRGGGSWGTGGVSGAGGGSIFNQTPGAAGSVSNGNYVVNGGGSPGFNPISFGGGGMVAPPDFSNMINTIGLRGGGTASGPPVGNPVGAINRAIFGSQGFGRNPGTIGAIGGIASMAGGMIGGNVGSILSGVGGGIAAASSLSTILGISAIGGPLGLLIGGAIGGLMALSSILRRRNKTRRTEEVQRTAILLSSKDRLNKLLKDVQRDKIDGDSAIEQADSIRADYLQQVSQLTDKKTRNIAIAVVRELDVIISQIKTAAGFQTSRRERLSMMVPTFASGGVVKGPGGPRDDMVPAMLSNREYVLDAETTRNIGVANLDGLRRTKGHNIGSLMRFTSHIKTPKEFAAGGLVLSGSGTSASSSPSSSEDGSMKVYITNNLFEDSDGRTRVQSEVWLETEAGKKKIIDAVEENIYRQRTQSRIFQAFREVQR